MDSIEHLYKCYEILSEAGDKIKEHVGEYEDILKAVKGTSKEKRLASQFIAKFFNNFPELTEKSIDAQLDLCEDDDMQIRRQAIKDLPKLCTGSAEITAKVGDTLAQLLVLDDPLELQQVNTSLLQILKTDAKNALKGIFAQITNGDEATRERCFKFISAKVLNSESKKDVEDFIIAEIKKVLQDVTSDEFHLCMKILGSTKLGTSPAGHAELVNLAKEQADLNTIGDLNEDLDEESNQRFVQCATVALPYFSSTIKSTDFVVYACDRVFPLNVWNALNTILVDNDQAELRVLKVFAEMTDYCGVLEKPTERLDAVYAVLREYMPLPKLDEEDVASTPPSFKFSHAECLLYAIHTLGKKHQDHLSFVKDPEKLKDFRARLQFLARGTQGYIKKLEEALHGKTEEELKTEANQLKLTALKTTSNISALIRDLFHTPPSFKHNAKLSWVKKKNAGLKRPIIFDIKNGVDGAGGGTAGGHAEAKKSKAGEQKIYSPPSGKFSSRMHSFGNNNGHKGNNQNNSNNKRSRQQRNGSRNSGGGGGGGGGGFNRNRRGFKKY